VNRGNRFDHFGAKLQLFIFMNTIKNLFAYISTMEKTKALHKSSRFMYCLLMDQTRLALIIACNDAESEY